MGGVEPEYEDVELSSRTEENFSKLLPGDYFVTKQVLKSGGYYITSLIYIDDAGDDSPYTVKVARTFRRNGYRYSYSYI